jgi:hypothetical protein
MDEFTRGTPSKPGRSRRQKRRVVILVICAALTLTVFACVCAVVVAAVVHGFGSLLDGLFRGLFASVAAFLMTVAASLLLAFPLLMELLALLSTGQVIPFVMRLAQLLGSF